VISRRQLLACGVSGSTISRWARRGRLRRMHPGVYAVGHAAVDLRGRLHAALLYAGAGSALSDQTAGWIWGFVASPPSRIHVSAALDRRSLSEVVLAAVLEFGAIRRALAEADLATSRSRCGRGAAAARPSRQHGPAAALRAHLPELARTRSELEQRVLELCEAHRIARPEVNVFIEGLMVDAHWREARLVVELDGHRAHDRIAAAERDRERDLILRRAGYRVHRYTWQQVTSASSIVASDVLGALGSR
jgi:very-short-patch-repair endonuclease